ncbi:MAG: hypothetical protein H6R13_2229 [Proteobacteria bacterium]|nr:hypothetical protein [Pseudomonadota bacterium]
MSILKDLDPNYEKTHQSNQGSNNWKVIALAVSVATIAFIGWTSIQNLVGRKTDDISASSGLPPPVLAKEKTEIAVIQPETKGAVIDELKPAQIPQNIEAANDASANRTNLAEQTSPPPMVTAPREQQLKEVREEKVAMAKPQSSPAPHIRKIEKAPPVGEKATADRDVAIIRSLVK